MRILVLDDMETRHRVFRQCFIGCDTVHVETAQQAISALRKGPRFDLAHLDHDLTEEHYDAYNAGRPVTDEGTGMEVVNFIVAMTEEARPKQVVVHSWNRRATEMVARLKDAGVPARWEMFKAPR